MYYLIVHVCAVVEGYDEPVEASNTTEDAVNADDEDTTLSTDVVQQGDYYFWFWMFYLAFDANHVVCFKRVFIVKI